MGIYAVDKNFTTRKRASWWIGIACLCLSSVIIYHFDVLFNGVVRLVTCYLQPLLGMVYCIVAGWLLHRNKLLQEIKQGNPTIANSFFFRVWPFFVRFIVPLSIIFIFLQTF